MSFEPRLDILPTPQRRLWDELSATPSQFTLYGGTALALHLGHRQSVDFDFFTAQEISPAALVEHLPYLRDAELVQSAPNTLTCRVDRGGEVLVSFFGGLPLRRVHEPEEAGRSGIRVASLLDLAATKVKVVLDRASAKDYRDVDALLRAGVELETALGAARTVYGHAFDPVLSLKALAYFDDGDVQLLPADTKERLQLAVQHVDLSRIPVIPAVELDP